MIKLKEKNLVIELVLPTIRLSQPSKEGEKAGVKLQGEHKSLPKAMPSIF